MSEGPFEDVDELDDRVTDSDRITLSRPRALGHALVREVFPDAPSEQEAWRQLARDRLDGIDSGSTTIRVEDSVVLIVLDLEDLDEESLANVLEQLA